MIQTLKEKKNNLAFFWLFENMEFVSIGLNMMFLSQLVFQTRTGHLTASRHNTDIDSLFNLCNGWITVYPFGFTHKGNVASDYRKKSKNIGS